MIEESRVLNNRNRHLIALLGLSLAAVVSLSLGGCGSSSTVEPTGNQNPFAASAVGTDSTLEVMTWNLENFAKNGSATAEAVILALEALDADIIGLQEIGNSMRFDQVVAGLDGYEGWLASSAGYDINLAFIYRTDGQLQVDMIEEIMTDQWSPFPRRPLLLRGSYNGQPIAVIDNHLKCCGDGIIDEGNSSDEETRRQTASLLLEEFAETHLSDSAVFIIGDFNDEITDAMDNNIFANFLEDPEDWRLLDMGIAEGPSSGWSFPGWPSHLDHIIVNRNAFTALSGGDYLVRVPALASDLSGGWSEYDQNISDHLPVITRLRF